MKGMRVGLGLALTLAVGIPAALPLINVFTSDGWTAWGELSRLGRLALTTLLLAGGTLPLSMPLGVAQAVCIFRTNLPLRRVFLLLNLLLLALPLPLHIMGWQAFLGPDGWLTVWTNAPGRSWIEGLGPAILIHAVAATPWVVVIVGAGLLQVERELEEQELLNGGAWHVLWSATLPRCRGVILVACGWVLLQTMNEVAVTDLLQVNTFAEEIRMRFVLGGGANLARAISLALPVILATWLLLIRLGPALERTLAPLQNDAARPRTLDLGPWRGLASLTIIVWFLLVFFGPTIGLVERLGRSGYPPTWDASEAWMHLQVVARLHGGSVAWMLAAALFTGLLTAALALACSWAMLDGPRFRTIVWSLAALCWALPAPAVGLGLKTFIGFVVEQVPPHSPLDWLLYLSGPTPIIWAHLIRFFPSALVILWPVVRMTASELRDAARLVGPASEFRLAVWPTSRSAFWAATMAVAALSLGEVGAATLVANPGSDTFAKLLLDTMHTGLDSTLAGLGLLLLGSGLALGVIVGFVWRRL